MIRSRPLRREIAKIVLYVSAMMIEPIPEFFLPVAGDTASANRVVDEALTLIMRATTLDATRWESAGEELFGDEFSVSRPDLLDAEWRLAYVAKLARSAAMAWGLGTDTPNPDDLGVVRMNEDAAATPLRRALADTEVKQ